MTFKHFQYFEFPDESAKLAIAEEDEEAVALEEMVADLHVTEMPDKPLSRQVS